MEPGAYIAGEVGRFLGALTSMGVLSRLSAFIFSKFKVGPRKRYIISDLLVMCFAVTVSMHFTNNPKNAAIYVIGTIFLLAYDMQKVAPWIHKTPETSQIAENSFQPILNKYWQVIKKLESFDVVRIAMSLALLISLCVSEYEDIYKGICFAAFGVCAYAAYLAIRKKEYGWMWALTITAIIYHPFQRAHYGMFQIEYKSAVNIITSIVLLLSIRVLRSQASLTTKNAL